MGTCKPLQGKSLAPVILGTNSSLLKVASEKGVNISPSQLYNKRLLKQQSTQSHHNNLRRNLISSSSSSPLSLNHQKKKSHSSSSSSLEMPILSRKFAVSQMWRCVEKTKLQNKPDSITAISSNQVIPIGTHPRDYSNPWFECNRDESKNKFQLSVMGYSFRTSDYRYTVYYHFDRINNVPLYNDPPYAEELYDHRGEVLSNFTHLELVNLIGRTDQYGTIAAHMRQMAIQFLQKEVVFHGPYK